MSTETEPTDIKEEVLIRDFFLKLRQLFPIKLIYYPASGRDNTLLEAFELHEVVLLDSDGFRTRKEIDEGKVLGLGLLPKVKGRPFVLGNYDYAPFKDEVFDAIYYNCNYSQEEGFKEMIRTLKKDGLVIFGNITPFDGIEDEDLDKLEEINLPFEYQGPNNPFIVAQKIRS